MANLSERVARLETAAGAAENEPLTDDQRDKLAKSLPNDVLRHYVDGDLDEQAARLSGITAYLRGLQEGGFAIEVDGHWHPLFIGDVAEVNTQVLARIAQLDEERVRAGLARRSEA